MKHRIVVSHDEAALEMLQFPPEISNGHGLTTQTWPTQFLQRSTGPEVSGFWHDIDIVIAVHSVGMKTSKTLRLNCDLSLTNAELSHKTNTLPLDHSPICIASLTKNHSLCLSELDRRRHRMFLFFATGKCTV